MVLVEERRVTAAPSRGSPAPVHGSEPPDRPDRKPSRTACSSTKTKSKSIISRFNVKHADLRQLAALLQMQCRCE